VEIPESSQEGTGGAVAATVVPLVPPEAVERAAGGDVRAFETIYRSHSGRVHALCLRLTGNPDEAADATQETFVKAWRRLDTFEGRSALSTWLHRLAVNAVLDRKRAAGRRPEVPTREGDSPSAAGPRRRPDLAIDLERAIAGLPEGARMAFVLHDVEGYRHREIAEMTGTAEGTWRAQLHRARKLLKEALSR
jgi:RNA polymerase sigma-70 factor (ECF subfamily)